MDYVIGIDAGGTKVHVMITNLSGKVLGEGLGGPANLYSVTEQLASAHVEEAVEAAYKAAGIKEKNPRSICMGIAGLDSPHYQALADKLLFAAFPDVPKMRRKAVNDVVIARRSNSESKYGFAIISGTGSNAYAVHPNGKEAFAGGMGHLLADEGGAYSVGLQVLRAAVRDEDEREPSVIGDMVKEKLGVGSMRDAIQVIYGDDFGKKEIADFAPIVDLAGAQDDAVARRILEEAASELVLMITTLARRLDMEDMEASLVMIGSQLKHSEVLQALFRKKMGEVLPKVEIIAATHPPVLGAVRLAIDLLS